METEEVSQTEQNKGCKPPRKPAIFGIFRDLYQRHRGDKRKKEKEYTFHQENERTMANWSRRVGLFTFILAATSIFGNWVIWKQLKEMQSSGEDTKALVKAAQDSAKAAQDAVAAARENSQRQLRAYIAIEAIDCTLKDGKARIRVALRNSGQTPAYDVQTEINVQTEVAGVFVKNVGSSATGGKGVVGYNTTIYAYANYASYTNNDDFIAILKRTDSVIHIFGTAQYRDAFGGTHSFGFKFRSTGFENNQWNLQPDPDGNQAD
jgi:hypothetical protein